MKPKVAALFFCLGIAAIPAIAVRMIPIPIDELTARADLVVRGVVQSRTVRRDPAGRIYTCASVRVAEVWKGTETNTLIEVVHSGGTLGNETVRVDGEVGYRPGEEVVAFLLKNPSGRNVTIGLSQGKFQVSRPTDGSEATVCNPFFGGNGKGETIPPVSPQTAGATGVSSLTLSGLRARVLGGKAVQ